MTSVDVVLKPSAQAHRLLFWLHILPLALLPFSMEPGPIMLALACVIAGSWAMLRRHPSFGFGPKAIVRIVASPGEDRWQVANPAGTLFDSKLEASSSVYSRLVILNFLVGDKRRRRTRILFGDEAGETALRRLRVRLGEARAGRQTSEDQS